MEASFDRATFINFTRTWRMLGLKIQRRMYVER